MRFFYIVSLLLVVGCGEVEREYREISIPEKDDPKYLAKPETQNSDGSLRYEDGFVEGPSCTEEGEMKHGVGAGYILKSLSDVWAKSRTGPGVKWSDAEQNYFIPTPDKLQPGEHVVFSTQDTHQISWKIEWHHRVVEGSPDNPELIKIGYSMTYADKVFFLTPIVEWKGGILLRRIAPGITGFRMHNYISGRASCTNSQGAVSDIFNNLH